ncbi:hypothetical protein HLB44_25755 [Aquincola sp. S2]|uniref:DUF3108 domain-containing protein n=1 Tax=Pseudaquabacterium terrae TaxID=2732868 RepID=A0ABX2EP43_9BURK|nr:hypothetical protein [Aquabacterium terrae]NRF70416.1 hypothetical protein [Aquabacterium terrae]
MKPLDPVFGFLVEGVDAGGRVSEFCGLEMVSKLPPGAMLVVVKKMDCRSKYGTSYAASHLRVLHRGKEYFVSPEHVRITPQATLKLSGRDDAATDSSLDAWRQTSNSLHKLAQREALKALDATGKRGVAILKTRIFDASEHTEGTGFSVSVYNSGKKAIKYITFSVTGFNAVNDAVRDRLRGSTVVTLRGIGPIEPEATASYRNEYMWSTDLVQSHRVTQVRLEFMDGTRRVLADVPKLRLSPADYAALNDEE